MNAPDNTLEPDLSGRTLDRYRLLRRLGVGGMGAVYEAEHTRLRKCFAVKILRHELAANELFRRRFLREARAASAVSHPHVVAISDYGDTDDGHVFFVMELLTGQDLHDLLEAEHILPWPRAKEILLQTTSALQAAHEQGIVHRDIKPSNVFLPEVAGKSGEDLVKVLDFGIAKLSNGDAEATSRLTSTGEIFGTVAYMAPEMVLGKSDDPRSDIYAVGVMMYRMLTGRLPYSEGNAFQILSQHINAPIPSPRDQNPTIPESVAAIVVRAMAKSPEERFASMEEFLGALQSGTPEGLQVQASAKEASASEKQDPDTATVANIGSPRSEAVDMGPQLRTEVASPLPLLSPFAATVAEADSVVPDAQDSGTKLDNQGTTRLAVEGPASAPRSMEPVGASASEQQERDEPRRSMPTWLLLVVGSAAALGFAVVGLWILSNDDESPPGSGAAAESTKERSAYVGEPVPAAVPESTPASTTAGKRPAESETPPTELPAQKEPPASEQEQLSLEPKPAANDDAEQAPNDEPARATTVKNSAEKPKILKPRRKPKTDQQVVATLKTKIATQCKSQLKGKVKVEGMISTIGRVEGLLITPPDGLGGCEKFIKSAKFDPDKGVRPLPRFWVE